MFSWGRFLFSDFMGGLTSLHPAGVEPATFGFRTLIIQPNKPKSVAIFNRFHQFPGRRVDIRQPARFAVLPEMPGDIVEFLNDFQLSPEGERVKFAMLLEPASLPRR
jgi:hypothetical protein